MLLLDTQVLVWLLDDNPRLGPIARARIAGAREVFVSAVSAWELTIKAMIGKLVVPDDLVELVSAQGLSWLSITPAHAHAIVDFPELARHDPFDRLMLAQARAERLRFVTADRTLLRAGFAEVVDAER